MELLNEMARAKASGAYGTAEWNETVDIYLRMLSPVAPHISEELWSILGKPYSIHLQKWAEVDEAATKVDEITLVVQVNGKVRERISVPADIGAEDAKKAALESEVTKKFLAGKTPKQVIYVPGNWSILWFRGRSKNAHRGIELDGRWKISAEGRPGDPGAGGRASSTAT